MRAVKILLTGGVLLTFSAPAFAQKVDWDSLNREVLALVLNGNFSKALPRAQEALKSAQKRYGPNHLRTGRSLASLGFIHLNLNQHPKAETLLTRAVKIFASRPETDRADYVQALNSLARIYQAKNEPARAETLYTRALNLIERAALVDSQQLAQTLNNLAGVYTQMENFPAAESLCRRSLAIRENSLGPLSPITRQTLDNLIYLNARQEKYPRAESLARKAFNATARFRNLYPLETANYQNSLGTFCHLQGKFAQAESMFLGALFLRIKTLGPDHPNVAKTLDNLAEARKGQKKYDGLDTLYERIVEILKKNTGAENPAVADKLETIARFYESIGQTQVAKRWAERATRARPKAKPDGNQ